MKVFNITWIVLYFKVILAREEWIDPHDMNIRTKPTLKVSVGYSDYDDFHKEKSSPYLKKVIGLVVNVAKFDMDFNLYRGQMDIELSREDYDFLKKFISTDDIDDSSLRRLDAVLDSSLQKSTFDTVVLKMSEYIYIALFNEHTAIFLGLLFLLYILWKIQPHKYTIKSLFKLFLPLVYISDFILKYRALLEEVEIDQYLEQKKQNCNPNNLGWIDWFINKFTGFCTKDERKYLLSQRAAIHVITPMKVISQQFDIIVPILKYVGEGFGKFIWALIEDVPWYVKPFVAVLAFILVIIIILMLGSYLLEISPKFNIFHMLKIEFLHKEQNIPIERNQQDSISGKNLRLLLESKNNNSDGNRNFALRSKQSNYVSYKTKKMKEPIRRKVIKFENADQMFNALECDKSEKGVGVQSSSSSSSGVAVH